MSSRKSFHVADKISCCQKLTHIRAKMISCQQNAFHVTKTFSCHQKYFSCRQKLNFMSPNLFHVAEKVDFSNARLYGLISHFASFPMCSLVGGQFVISTHPSKKSTFSATWNNFDDMKFSFWRHEIIYGDMKKFWRHEMHFADMK